MIAAERVSPPAPARAAASRSPFVRLRELLGDSAPGLPAISLAVGEPQHAVPSFVGPVLAAHIEEFGRYPMNKGLDAFCSAAAGWLGRSIPIPKCWSSAVRARGSLLQRWPRNGGSVAEPTGLPFSCPIHSTEPTKQARLRQIVNPSIYRRLLQPGSCPISTHFPQNC